MDIEPSSAATSGAADRDPDIAGHLQVLRLPLARYFSRRVADKSEVDDLVHDVFLRILRHGEIDRPELLAAYVFKTAANILKDRYRRRAAQNADHHVPFVAELHGDAASPPDVLLIAREALFSTGEILKELPECTQAVFLLRRIEGLPYAEISVRLRISLSTVEKHMLRATRHLIARSRGDDGQ